MYRAIYPSSFSELLRFFHQFQQGIVSLVDLVLNKTERSSVEIKRQTAGRLLLRVFYPVWFSKGLCNLIFLRLHRFWGGSSLVSLVPLCVYWFFFGSISWPKVFLLVTKLWRPRTGTQRFSRRAFPSPSSKLSPFLFGSSPLFWEKERSQLILSLSVKPALTWLGVSRVF